MVSLGTTERGKGCWLGSLVQPHSYESEGSLILLNGPMLRFELAEREHSHSLSVEAVDQIELELERNTKPRTG